ncbi:unnamed protein product [Pleuronectes platessa]|uniref:Uncharacterized protein n=1 Tax=Pleuronectes platessa TaxID=8262 RepID=A0A9N7V9H5_PLEPL|nr:unnamed protein product [Pleuronectes platessa]
MGNWKQQRMSPNMRELRYSSRDKAKNMLENKYDSEHFMTKALHWDALTQQVFSCKEEPVQFGPLYGNLERFPRGLYDRERAEFLVAQVQEMGGRVNMDVSAAKSDVINVVAA